MKLKSTHNSLPLNLIDGQNIILDSIADGVFTVNKDWRITSFNRAAEKITGVSREEAIGQLCKDVLKADICEKSCCLRSTMKPASRLLIKKCKLLMLMAESSLSAFPPLYCLIKVECFLARSKLLET